MFNLTLDFETYYDKEFSLSKMPTAQYVRDPRCEILGCAVKLDDGPSKYLTGDALVKFLAAVPWGRARVIAHNASFDGLILFDRFGYSPAEYFCTMFMLRYLIAQGVLDARQGTSLKDAAPLVGLKKGDLDKSLEDGTIDEYATLDADICAALYEEFADMMPDDERVYADLHVRMAAEPVFRLDEPRLHRLANADKALEEVFPLVRKDDVFAASLDKLGVMPEYKTTDKGNIKLATAKTDKFMQRLLAHKNPKVRLLAEIRKKAGSTIERSRAQRFLDVGSPLPAPMLYYGAHTGRGSGRDKINVMNLKRDGDLRGSILAPDGHKLVIVDSSQIEVRVLGYLAGEEKLLSAFREGRDPYIAFAAEELYPGAWPTYEALAEAVAAEDKTAKGHRQVAKAAVLALGFGQGANGFVSYCEQFGIPMDPDYAQDVVRAYRMAYPKITGGQRIGGFWKETQRRVRQTGETVLPSGRRITYPELRVRQTGETVLPSGHRITYPGSRIGGDVLEYRRHLIFAKAKHEGFSNLWHGKLVENAVQACARDVVFAQTARLARKGYRIALSVYDEAVLVVPDEQVEQAVADAEVAFGSTPRWAPNLPVAGEVNVSDRYMK